MSRDDAILLDIVKSAKLAKQFTGGMEKADFMADVKTQAAVLHELMVLGEAAKRLSETFRSIYPQIPWALIAGMRDKLIHEYNDVDLEEVWATVTRDIPRLLKQIEPLIRPDG
jgi:uncharacterized protein with HEPN domain